MVQITVRTKQDEVWHIHRYSGGPRVRPDKHGKVTGYRCTPNSNKPEDAVSFENISEAADFLRRNPSWGARFSPNGNDTPQNIFVKGIEIDGVPR